MDGRREGMGTSTPIGSLFYVLAPLKLNHTWWVDGGRQSHFQSVRKWCGGRSCYQLPNWRSREIEFSLRAGMGARNATPLSSPKRVRAWINRGTLWPWWPSPIRPLEKYEVFCPGPHSQRLFSTGVFTSPVDSVPFSVTVRSHALRTEFRPRTDFRVSRVQVRTYRTCVNVLKSYLAKLWVINRYSIDESTYLFIHLSFWIFACILYARRTHGKVLDELTVFISWNPCQINGLVQPDVRWRLADISGWCLKIAVWEVTDV